MATKPLKLLERILTDFFKCGLKSLDNKCDFDSAIRRFESSRPSHAFRECADFAICGAERASADAEIRTDGSGSVPTDFRVPSPIPTFQSPEVAGGLDGVFGRDLRQHFRIWLDAGLDVVF